MSERIEYRVIWRREGMKRPKVRRVKGRSSAERFVGLLTSDEPWLFMRDQVDPDDYHCCSGYACNCLGITVREHCANVRADLPPIESIRIESRVVAAWAPIDQPAVIEPARAAVTRETATVYRGGGRRWLTKASALRAEAKARINRRCECEPSEQDEYGRYTFGGWACRYHEDLNDPDSWARRFFRRYLRWLQHCARKAEQPYRGGRRG